jgi:hypothetical protein
MLIKFTSDMARTKGTPDTFMKTYLSILVIKR